MLSHGGAVVVNRPLEKGAHLVRELIELFHPRPDEVDETQEPVVTGASELGCPEARVAQCGLYTPRQFVERQPLNVLLIEPVELLWIEDRVATADPFKRERCNQFVAREQLAIVSWRPAEQREEVDHRFWQVPKALVLHHRRRAMPFAQSFFVRPENQRNMRELRMRHAERLVEDDLLGR